LESLGLTPWSPLWSPLISEDLRIEGEDAERWRSSVLYPVIRIAKKSFRQRQC